MELKHRIKCILEYSGKNQSEFSRFVGFKTPQAVGSLIRGKTKTLSMQSATLLMNAFPEIDENWLRTGEGEMLKDSSTNVSEVSGDGNIVGMTVTQTIGENSGQNAGRDINNYGERQFLAALEAQRALAQKQLEVYEASLDRKDEQLRTAQSQIDTLIHQNQEQFNRLLALIETLKS